MEIVRQLEKNHEVLFRGPKGFETFAEEFVNLLLANPESREDWFETEPEDIGTVADYFTWRINRKTSKKYRLTDWSRIYKSGKIVTEMTIASA